MDNIASTKVFGINMPGKLTAHSKAKLPGFDYDYVAKYEGNFNDLLSFYSDFDCSLLDDTKRNVSELINNVAGNGKNEWVGGSHADLKNPHVDFSHYEAAKKQISQSKVWKNVVTSIDQKNVRRRIRSEHDGELDYDKIYDVQPFQRREKRKDQLKIVRLYVDASFSCNVSAEKINGFGAFVSAMINIIESNGVNVEIYACYQGTGFMSNKYGSCFRFEIKVKRPDQYLPVAQLLKVFSANWYRRAIFGLIVSSAEIFSDPVCHSLGVPYSFGKCWEIKDNNVHIYSVPSIEQQNDILESLAKFVGVETQVDKKIENAEIPF